MKTRIKEFRAKFNLTQAELAQKVGARRETISFLEKGEYNPSLKLAIKIAQQFRVSVEELFIFEDGDLD
ncbi:helix-turn-helix transcriptional regulator [Brevibacillus reuszeri]|uniref:helix-turn-helix transcriptional regulator n=1 Tax=Brevibacillus reuszeri TaxID=54915 RepID=UPI00289C3677|nr:helix-turn-helix transcriptional regulator [Brevibacillus reuszeri]